MPPLWKFLQMLSLLSWINKLSRLRPPMIGGPTTSPLMGASEDLEEEGDPAPEGGLARFQDVRQPTNSGGGSTASRPFHWSYNHNRDYPITEDESRVAHLLPHIKGHDCQIPTVKNLTETEAFIEMMVKNGQVRIWVISLLLFMLARLCSKCVCLFRLLRLKTRLLLSMSSD